MYFTNTLLAAAAVFIPTTSATQGIFAINGTGTVTNGAPGQVYLAVYNGLVTDPPMCDGYTSGLSFPFTSTVPCSQEGYCVTFTWPSPSEAISATYTDPTSTFTYNVPNNGIATSGDDAGEYQFGFVDLFGSKKTRRSPRA
jgi:hypothetical protein